MKTFWCLTIAFFLAGSAVAQESGQADSAVAEERKEAMEAFRVAAAEYKIQRSGEDELFKLNEKPILHWTNPARQNENGAVYLWMRSGRPEVIGCCFTYVNEGEVFDRQEFHSLSTVAIVAEVAGKNVWRSTAGLKFKPIPDAPVPGESFHRQKLQMRQLSRLFSGDMEDELAGPVKLRLIPAPLTLYQPKNHVCKAGAIYSLAYGTDPEILVIIECRDDKGDGNPTWQYALARYHYNALTASLNGKQIWSVDAEHEHKTNHRSANTLGNRPYMAYYPD